MFIIILTEITIFIKYSQKQINKNICLHTNKKVLKYCLFNLHKNIIIIRQRAIAKEGQLKTREKKKCAQFILKTLTLNIKILLQEFHAINLHFITKKTNELFY